jgi:hypothetical protein
MSKLIDSGGGIQGRPDVEGSEIYWADGCRSSAWLDYAPSGVHAWAGPCILNPSIRHLLDNIRLRLGF